MAAKIEAYIDTSALIAFLDRSDTYHALFSRLFADPPALLTNVLVLAEGHAWFLRRYDQTRALQFLSFVDELAALTVVSVGAADLEGAKPYLRKYSDQPMTLTDAVGLFLMNKHRARNCWSTDRHLGLSGVPLVIDSST